MWENLYHHGHTMVTPSAKLGSTKAPVGMLVRVLMLPTDDAPKTPGRQMEAVDVDC